MLLSELIDGLGVWAAGSVAGTPLAPAVGALRICDINEDSRTVVPGSLFIARGGTKADGKKFAADAVKAGAVAVLTDDAGLRVPGAPVLVSGDVQLCTAQ